uniref:cytochrome b n=1 Tax=Laemobothrion maximum TaxID=2337902 RepID=UPI00257A8F95|nr:cytochrome b [Laemobothrion maximum]WGU50341.1 cytochrome b [Laemobothrion maximum]
MMSLNKILRLPTPSNLDYNWSFGSLLGMFILIQISSGLFLTFQYSSSMNETFTYILHIMQDVNSGWLLRYIHANGASYFFILLYLHIARGLYYKSFKMMYTWMLGISIYLFSMITAFLGYVLPWGQMSYWGATVITNLISSVPYIGNYCVIWIWGGFSVSGPTLTRFFSFHFILPFFIIMLITLHLFFLHNSGSCNPLKLPSNTDKLNFHPFYSLKDIIGLFVPSFSFSLIILNIPTIFMDPDNFEEANPMRTPIHIQPEWYFLFAYAILRSVPNKLGGVFLMILSVSILYFFPFFFKGSKVKYFSYKLICIAQFIIFLLLMWLGAKPLEFPYTSISQLMSILYFLNISLLMLLS